MPNIPQVLTHSSIRVTGSKTLYFDPYEIKEASHDADIIFVTHDHFDHYSPEDIKKIIKEGTLLFLPECMKAQAKDSLVKSENYHFIAPNESAELEGITVKAIPAYNPLKPFHPKGKNYVGYLVTLDETTYYIAGDTDMTLENQQIKCDVALVPVGGKFTMDYKEAAKLVNVIQPKLAIPTHCGSVAGSADDGRKFAELVNQEIEVKVII